MLFSDWSEEVSKSWLIRLIHLKRCLAFCRSESTEAEKVIGYLAKFALPKMQKVDFLGQESDWILSKCLLKVRLKCLKSIPMDVVCSWTDHLPEYF